MNAQSCVLTVSELLDRLTPLRGQSVVITTNGCFDILHIGHLRYLEACKQANPEKPEVLIVMVNSDTSVQRLKGPLRPMIPEADRAELLAGLACVDYVVLFNQDTPEDLIRKIKPDFHAKGAQYTEDSLPEMDTLRSVGAKVRFIPMVAARSTTNVIDTIVSRCCPGTPTAPTCEVG